MINSEKIGPILRKIDYLWSKNPEKNLCDIIKELNNDKFEYLTDRQLINRLKDVCPDEK